MAGKIAVLIASPRANGNSAHIAKAMADECKKNGREVETFLLDKIEGLHGCRNCNACKTAGRCVTKDATLKVLDSIRDADGVVISTPLYFNEEAGPLKLVLDRFWGFITSDYGSNIAEPPKAAIAVSCMSGKDSADRCADHIQQVCGMAGIPVVGRVCVADPDNTREAVTPDVVEQAKQIADKL